MRQGGSNGRRPRGGRHHGGGSSGGNGGGNNGGGNTTRGLPDSRPRSAQSLRHQTFDSNCIEVRVRGNAWQVHEKYQNLARDAQSSGDRVAAEHYLQHAEHYYRIIEAINEATAAEQPARNPNNQGGNNGTANAQPNNAPQSNGNYNVQPDMPTNYYGGGPAPATTQHINQPNTHSHHQVSHQTQTHHTPPGAPTLPPDANGISAPMGQAEVQMRNQPPMHNPYFSQSEIDENGNPLPAVASR